MKAGESGIQPGAPGLAGRPGLRRTLRRMDAHLRIECRKCGRVVHKNRGPFTEEEKRRLKCAHCGAGNPFIDERLPRTPYTKSYRPA